MAFGKYLKEISTVTCLIILSYATFALMGQFQVEINSSKRRLQFLHLQLKHLGDQMEFNLEDTSIPEHVDDDLTNGKYICHKRGHIPGCYNNSNTTALEIVRWKEANYSLPKCSLLPQRLQGRIDVPKVPKMAVELEKMFPDVMSGGHFRQKHCKSKHKVAIIIPYRDRREHLHLFLEHMHSLLQRQNIEYAIFVIELMANTTFNRAFLMNIGFVESNRFYDWDCQYYHDIDLLPEDDRNLYFCHDVPQHMSVAVSTFDYSLPYLENVGGVTMLRKEHMLAINGFPNLYFGWGGEDDDLWKRLKESNIPLNRFSQEIGRFKMLSHKKDKPNEKRVSLLNTSLDRHKIDGLNSLEYFVIKREIHRLYVRVLVTYDPGLEMQASLLRN